MARILILDGYNIIGARGGMRADREILEKERRILVGEVSEWATGRDFSEIHLVFDGYPTDRDLLLIGGGVLRVVFSEGAHNADAVIVALARKYRERAAVVTSDREVRRDAASFGAEPVGAKDFLERLDRRRARPSSHAPRSDAALEKDAEGEAPPPTFGKKRGNPHRLSRKDRAQKKLLDKL